MSSDKVKTKKCSTCKTIKPVTEFYKNKIMKDGLQYHCKPCCKELKKRTLMRTKNKYKFKKVVEQDIMNLPDLNFRDSLLKKNDVFFSSTFIAQSRSGKTYLLKHILKSIRDIYDIVIVITKNTQNSMYKGTDHIIDFVTTGHNNQYKKIIKMIRLFQEKTKNKLLNWLVIFDDFSKPRCPLMRDLYTDGRNARISVIHLVQDTTMAMNQCRFNSLHIFLFHQKNPKLIKRVIEEFVLDFVPVPKEIKTKADKKLFLREWLQHMTQDYTSVVLNVDEGKIMKIRAP